MDYTWVRKWMYQIPYLNLSKQKLKVYAYMYYISDYAPDGDIYVSQKKIAEAVDMQASNVSNTVRALVKDNLLVITKKAVKSPNPLHKRSAHYRIVIPEYVNTGRSKVDETVMKEKLNDAVERQQISNNQILIDYIKQQTVLPNDTKELMIDWLSDPLKDGTYINDTLGRFKLKLNELVKFCSYSGKIDWNKFNEHIARAYKCAGVKLIYDSDKSAEAEHRGTVVGL